MNWLTDLLGGITGGLTAIVQGWQTRQTARVEADVERIKADATIAVARATSAAKLAEQGQANDAAWDILVAGQMERTWKDEWFAVLFSVPLVLAFIDPPLVQRGFAALDQMPGWYFYSLGTIIAATFGVRRLLNLFDRVRGR